MLPLFPMIVADFSSEYGIRLLGSGMRWPEFDWHVRGLLSARTRLLRHFAPPDDESDEAEEG